MPSWTARVEWRTPNAPDAEALDDLHTALAAVHGSVGLEETVAGEELATMSATVTVDAGTLRQAIAAALRAVDDAGASLGQPIHATGLEILDTETHDRRSERPAIPPLVGYAEIAEVLGVSRQRARFIAEHRPDFPPAVVETASTGPLRLRTQVEAYAARRRPTGRPKKTQGVTDADHE